MEIDIIPTPIKITPIKVDITLDAEYPDQVWREVTATIDAAETEVIKARTVKRMAEMAYETAMAQRGAVQASRDRMIATDRRTPAQIGRLAGIGRARCSQIRIALQKRADAGTETTE